MGNRHLVGVVVWKIVEGRKLWVPLLTPHVTLALGNQSRFGLTNRLLEFIRQLITLSKIDKYISYQLKKNTSIFLPEHWESTTAVIIIT